MLKFWARFLRRIADRLAPAPPNPPTREAYLQWAVRERDYFWLQTVNAHETLRRLGCPPKIINQPYCGVMRGIEWLAEKEQVAS